MKFNLDVIGEYIVTEGGNKGYSSDFQTEINLTYPEYLGIMKLCKIFANSFDDIKTLKGFKLCPIDSEQDTFKTIKEQYDRGSSEVDLLLKTDKFANDEKEVLSNTAHNVLIHGAILDELYGSNTSPHGENIIEFFNTRFSRGLPLTPITGCDDEWELISTDTKKMFKNKRYPRLFKFEYPDSELPVFVDLDRFELYHTNRNAGDRFPSAIKVAIAKELAKLYPITFPYNPAIKRETVHVKVFSTKGTVFSNCDTVRLVYKSDDINSNKQYPILKNYKYENTDLVEISQKEYDDRKGLFKKNKYILKKELKEAFNEGGDE